MIYFWHVNRLAEDLKEQRLSQQEKFTYFCFSFAIMGKFTLFIAWLSIYNPFEALLNFCIGAAISIIGLIIGIIFIQIQLLSVESGITFQGHTVMLMTP